MTLMWAGTRGYHAEPKFPDVLTDDELRAVSVPALLVTGARSSLLTPAEAHARGSLMPHAEVAVVPGSHGGFNRIDELNKTGSPPSSKPTPPASTRSSPHCRRQLNGKTDITGPRTPATCTLSWPKSGPALGPHRRPLAISPVRRTWMRSARQEPSGPPDSERAYMCALPCSASHVCVAELSPSWTRDSRSTNATCSAARGPGDRRPHGRGVPRSCPAELGRVITTQP